MESEIEYSAQSIRIMPDFCSSGIWDNKTGIMVHYEDLELPEQL